MKIVQLNIRLNEGGAARIALDLHQRLLDDVNFNSYFLYGYGKGVRPNPAENNIKNTRMFSSKAKTYSNFISYKLLNKDFFGIIDNRYQELNKSDIVHLHVLHSYFMNFEKIVNSLLEYNKGIVWTIHDYWPITGRCAFTDGCLNWRTGCGNCPTKKNYPPVFFDFSKNNRLAKVKLVEKMLKKNSYLVSPSEHLYENLIEVYGDTKNIALINNGIDIETENKIKNHMQSSKNTHIKIGIVAHDLAYNGKTNFRIIQNLLTNNVHNHEFHFIGKNNPFTGENIFTYGYLSNKDKLLEIISQFDCLLFTSQVDNYPLVLCEVLSLGIPVVATRSAAASEIISKVGGRTFSDVELFELFQKQNVNFLSIYEANTKDDLAKKSTLIFSGNTMLEKYKVLYNKVIHG